MRIVWTRAQQAALAVLRDRWSLPSVFTPTYAPREIELAREAAARERARRRQRLTRQLAIAIGWAPQ